MWLCTYCEAANEDFRKRCVVCGRYKDEKYGDTLYCIHCGAKYISDEDNEYCMNCGKKYRE